MRKKTEKVSINGVVYVKEETGQEKRFSRYDSSSKMEVVNVFKASSDSRSRMENFKKSVAALLISND